jgi:amino acid transporter
MMDKLKALLGSRKVIMLILGIIYSLLTIFKEQLGFTMIDPEALVTTLAVICVYIFGEATADMKRQQKAWFPSNKWKEPQFWIGVIGAILPVITATLGIDIPVAEINGILTGVIGFIFSRKVKKLS